jgi:hypothetical protein
MVTMTLAQWHVLADYLDNVEFDDRDTLVLEAHVHTGRVTAKVLDHLGVVVDEVEVDEAGE